MHSRRIEKTVEPLVVGGKIKSGLFTLPFRDVNLDEARFPENPGLNIMRKIRLKEWLGFAIDHPDYYMTFFVQNAKYLASGLVYVVEKATGAVIRIERGGLSLQADFKGTLWDGICSFKAPGFSVVMKCMMDNNRHEITAKVARFGNTPAIDAKVIIHEDPEKTPPLVSSVPLTKSNNFYTHKVVAPAEGYVNAGKWRIELDPQRDLTIMDEHRSFLPYRTYWRWGTFAGRNKKGQIIGANLSEHDTSEDAARWNENCIWLGSEIQLIDEIKFTLPEDHMQPWTVHEKEGRAELEFVPKHDKVVKLDALVVAMDYFQPCGEFNGYIIDDSGKKHDVKGYYGVAEKADVRW